MGSSYVAQTCRHVCSTQVVDGEPSFPEERAGRIVTQGQCMEGVPIDGGGGLRAQICTVAALNSNVAVMPEESSTLQEWRPGLVLQRERQEHTERGTKPREAFWRSIWMCLQRRFLARFTSADLPVML